jgi:hypothetical protein
MGRPRKIPAERLSRYVQARVTDDQWNWLEYRAVEHHDGDLSKTLRECIIWSQVAVGIFDSADPHAKLDDHLTEMTEHEPQGAELVMDAEPGDDAT